MTRRHLLGGACSLVAGCGDERGPGPAPTITAEPKTPEGPDFWLAIQPGIHSATRVEPSIPAELGAIQQRFAEAAARDPAWLQAYLKELALPAGAPLPYHPKLGVTADEYRRLLEAYEHPQMVERERFEIAAKADSRALELVLPRALASEALLSVERSGRLVYGMRP